MLCSYYVIFFTTDQMSKFVVLIACIGGGGGVTQFRLCWIVCPLNTKIVSKNGDGIKSCEYFLDVINCWPLVL